MCQVPNSPILEKLNAALQKSWQSLGSVACKINEEPDCLEVMFFPAVRELHGGKHDGENMYAGFHLNVGRFIRVFDKNPMPKLLFDCLTKEMKHHLLFDGKIDGFNVKVAVLSEPPNGQNPVERLYTTGPKRGKIEKIEVNG